MINCNCIVDFLIALPEIYLAIIALTLLLTGTIFPKTQHILNYVTIFAFAITTYILLDLVGFESRHAFNDFYYTSSFIVFAKIILMMAGIFVIWLHLGEKYAPDSMLSSFEFPVIVMLAVLGMMIMLSADDFLLLYLGFELQSLSLYILAAFERNSLKSNEAGVKYFVLGALASGLMLYGISLVYGFTGTTNFVTLEELFVSGVTIETTAIGFIIGMVLIIIGFCFKISAVPFHMWTPDVYQGAPTIVTTLFATLPKVAALILLTRVLMEPFASWLNEWRQIIVVVSVLSMFIGSFGAIKQTNIKRLLAYSSIGHVGFILIGVASSNQEGLLSILFYIAIYVIMSLGGFAFVLMMKKDGEAIENIDALKGLAKTNPVMAFAISVIMFSMAGIPPLAGFYAKFYIFKAAIEAELYSLAVMGVIASVIAAYYYLRVVKYIYVDEAHGEFDKLQPKTRFVASFSTAFNLLYFLVPSSLIDLVFYAIAGM